MTPRSHQFTNYCATSTALLLLTMLIGRAQTVNSPVGTWEVAIKRARSSVKETGTAYLTFNSDQTLSGYGITTATPGIFTLDGTWSLNAVGRIIGNYTEDLNGTTVSGSFIGKARFGRAMRADVLAEN